MLCSGLLSDEVIWASLVGKGKGAFGNTLHARVQRLLKKPSACREYLRSSLWSVHRAVSSKDIICCCELSHCGHKNLWGLLHYVSSGF